MCITSQLLTPDQFFDLNLDQLTLLENYLEGKILSTSEIRNHLDENILARSSEALMGCNLAIQLLPKTDIRNRVEELAQDAYARLVPARKISKS